MSGLFGQPKVQKTAVADPNDLANRAGAERVRRLARGGAASTILSDAMSTGSAKPRSVLTGFGG